MSLVRAVRNAGGNFDAFEFCFCINKRQSGSSSIIVCTSWFVRCVWFVCIIYPHFPSSLPSRTGDLLGKGGSSAPECFTPITSQSPTHSKRLRCAHVMVRGKLYPAKQKRGNLQTKENVFASPSGHPRLSSLLSSRTSLTFGAGNCVKSLSGIRQRSSRHLTHFSLRALYALE